MIKKILVNWEDLKSIKKAERLKLNLENKGFILIKEQANYLLYKK